MGAYGAGAAAAGRAVTHVVFVNMPIEYYSPTTGGAISTIIREVSTVLLAEGHQVTVLTRTGEGVPHDVGDVVDLGPVPRLTGLARQVDRVTRRLLGREHARYEQYRRAVRRALRTAPAPVDLIVVFNDYVSGPWLRRACPSAVVVNWLQNDQPLPRRRGRSGTVLCCSDYVRDRAIERGVAAEDAWTAVSGVDAETFVPGADWPDASVPVRVLTIGRLDPNKGHDAALAAVAAAQQAGFSVTATLAGARWWYGNDQSDAHTDALLDAVTAQDGRYVGLVPRTGVPGLFRRHDVCMVLSRAQEPFGLVVLEAMASGCAVIASNRGGLPQACGGAALLVDPDDAAQVEGSLTRLLEDAQFLRAAREAARERALAAPWTIAASVLLDRVGSATTSGRSSA